MHFRHQPGGGNTSKQQQQGTGGQFNFVGGGGGGGRGGGGTVPPSSLSSVKTKTSTTTHGTMRNDRTTGGGGGDYSAGNDKPHHSSSLPGASSSSFPSAMQQLIIAGSTRKKNNPHKCGDAAAPGGDENDDCLHRPIGATTSSLSSISQSDVVGGLGLASRRPHAAGGGGNHSSPSGDCRTTGITAVAGNGNKKRNSDGFEDENDGGGNDHGGVGEGDNIGDVDKYFSDLFGDSSSSSPPAASSSAASASLRPKQPPPRNPPAQHHSRHPTAASWTRQTWENPLIPLLSKLRNYAYALKTDAGAGAATARGTPNINGRRGGLTPSGGPSSPFSAQQQSKGAGAGGGRRLAAARLGEGILVLSIVMLLFSGLQIGSMSGHNAEGMRRIKSRYRQQQPPDVLHEEGRDRPNSAAYLRAVKRHSIKAAVAAQSASASKAARGGERGEGGSSAAALSDAMRSPAAGGDGGVTTTHADKMMQEQRRQQDLLEKAQQQLKEQQEQQEQLLRQQREQLEFQKRLEEQQREQERQRQQLLEQQAVQKDSQAAQASDRPPPQQGVAEHRRQPQEQQPPPPPPQQQQQTNKKGGDEAELLPPSFRNLADFPSEPIPNGRKGGDVPVLWYVHHAGGSTFREIMGGCMGMTLASEVGAQFGHASDQTLQVFDQRGSKYVNVDTTTPAGLAKAKNLNLAGSGLPDVIITPFVHEVSELFTPDHRGRMFAVLRDPVERAVSMYGHMVKNNPSMSGMTVEEYARSDRVENNWMVRFLANAKTGQITNDHLVMAAEVLRTKFLIGLSDRKEETMERFRKYFGWSLVNMDSIEGRRECIGKLLTRPHEDEEVPEKVEQGTRAYSLLQWQNQYDLKLYKYGLRLFESQKEFV